MATEATGGSGAVVGDERAAILSELAAEKSAAPVEEVAAEEVETASQDEAVEEVEAAADEDSADEDEVEEVEATDDEAEEADEDEDVELKSDDPVTQKRLDQVRRAEKRMREAEARRDADFADKQRQWQKQVDRVAEIDKLAARIKYDPIPALRALGVSDEDLITIAQAAYAESPEGQKDPARKAAAQQRLKEREKEDEIAAVKRENAEIRKMIEERDQAAKAQAEASKYIADINATAAKQYPLVAGLLKADPDETNDALVALYNTLGKKNGKAPKPAELVAAYDKKERARLTKLGVDLSKYTKPGAVKTVANTNKPGAKPTVAGKPAANTNATKQLTDEEEREAILAELRS